MQFREMIGPCVCIGVPKLREHKRHQQDGGVPQCIPEPVRGLRWCRWPVCRGVGKASVRCWYRDPVLTLHSAVFRTPSVKSGVFRCEVSLAERRSLPCAAHLGMPPQYDLDHGLQSEFKGRQWRACTALAERSASRREKEDKLMGDLPV